MGEPTPSRNLSRADQLLDLLLDALLERQAARRGGEPTLAPVPAKASTPTPAPAEASTPGSAKASIPDPVPAKASTPGPATPGPAEASTPAPVPAKASTPGPAEASSPDPAKASSPDSTPLPARLPSVHLGRTLGRLLMVLVVLVVLVNVPINRYGTSLARIMPDTASLVIRDGLVLKGSSPDIYVLQDDKLRWISSLEAFEYFGYHWDQVHEVDDEFLASFEKGKPIHVLLKCQGSPHIYALENGAKRWIKDIPTFEAEGYVWQDVKIVDCSYLRRLPDGPPIPEDAGPPPEP